MKINFYLFIFTFIFLFSCGQNEKEPAHKHFVARAGQNYLTKADVINQIPKRLNSQDSSAFVENYIQNWVRDKLFLDEAVSGIKDDSTLQYLIADYRNSLLQHLYEKQIVSEKLDSTINQEELNAYYEKNKSQFILKSSILRCHLIKIDKSMEEEYKQIRTWWTDDNEESQDSLIRFANEYAQLFLLEDSTWYKIEDILGLLPSGVIKTGEVNRVRDERFSDDTSRYFLRILEQLPDTEIAPLSFIEKQARKVILHKRKRTLIRRKREALFDDALNTNRTEINR